MRELIFKGNTDLESSMLRSILLFTGNNELLGAGRMMPAAVLSLISHGNGNYGKEDIEKLLSDRFGVQTEDLDLGSIIRRLISERKIEEIEGNRYKSLENREGSIHFFEDLNRRTEELIDNIISKLRSIPFLTVPDSSKPIIRENIKNALSSYYSRFGYSFFSLKPNCTPEKLPDAVASAKAGLDSKIGEALVGVLANTLTEPSSEEKEILEVWARAYVALQVLNLDPTLRNFKITKLRNKTFFIDTDFALELIVSNTRFSEKYQRIGKRLSSYGCKLLIPNFVLQEIEEHVKSAYNKYHFYKEDIVNLPPEHFYTSNSNAFIESYMNTVKDKEGVRDYPFDVFMRNIFVKEYPDILKGKFQDVLGENFESVEIRELSTELSDKLADAIKKETEQTGKGARRWEEQNDVMAKNDAALYLEIRARNTSEDNPKPLSESTYLITGSRKTIHAAKLLDVYEKEIICNPDILIATLDQIGQPTQNPPEYLNLFQNPFLADTADRI